MQTERDAPDILMPPPLISAIAVAAGVAIDHFLPARVLPGRARFVLGAALAAGGGVILPFVLWRFRPAETHFDPRKPASSLITSGPYSFSRNPAYVALTLLHLGIAAAVGSAWVLAGVAPAVALIDYGVIRPEERYLEKKFGEEYRRYKRAVRRWL